MIKVGDLFAGIGGIALGLKKAGFEIAWANEFDRNASITYRSNFEHKLVEQDIRKVDPDDLEKVDMIVGGFPCQAFSIAGYRHGFKDERGNLFFDILRFIDSHHPEIIFLENVKNLATHDDGNTFERIKIEIENRNYFLKYAILNTCEVSDIPQNRERLYMVAFRNKLAHDNFEFPKKSNTRKNIQDLLDNEVAEKYYYKKTKYYPELKRTMRNPNTVYQWRRKYVRENKNGLCPTLTANMGMGGHNVPLIIDKQDIRKMIPRECLRFQGFPEDFKIPNSLPDSALYKQAGNSVSVPVIYKIALNIKQSYELATIQLKKDKHVYQPTA